MSRDSLKGNAPVTMVTSFPESGNETSRWSPWSLLVQPSGVQFRFWRNCRGRCIYTASRARHICMLRDNWPVIDWREPIGLQERLEGRSSHNGEISVMSRSRFQGTEVTIVTGAFSALIGRTRDSLHIRWAVGGDCSQRLRDRLTLTECRAQTGCIEPNSAFKH